MTVASEPSSNKHYEHPYKVGEKVIYLGEIERNDKHPESFFDQFIRIKRLKHKGQVMVESRKNFQFVNPNHQKVVDIKRKSAAAKRKSKSGV